MDPSEFQVVVAVVLGGGTAAGEGGREEPVVGDIILDLINEAEEAFDLAATLEMRVVAEVVQPCRVAELAEDNCNTVEGIIKGGVA